MEEQGGGSCGEPSESRSGWLIDHSLYFTKQWQYGLRQHPVNKGVRLSAAALKLRGGLQVGQQGLQGLAQHRHCAQCFARQGH